MSLQAISCGDYANRSCHPVLDQRRWSLRPMTSMKPRDGIRRRYGGVEPLW